MSWVHIGVQHDADTQQTLEGFILVGQQGAPEGSCRLLSNPKNKANPVIKPIPEWSGNFSSQRSDIRGFLPRWVIVMPTLSRHVKNVACGLRPRRLDICCARKSNETSELPRSRTALSDYLVVNEAALLQGRFHSLLIRKQLEDAGGEKIRI